MRTATELLEAAKDKLLDLDDQISHGSTPRGQYGWDDDDARKLYDEIIDFLHEKRGKI